MGAYLAAAKSCESTFYEVAPYRPNALGAAEFRCGCDDGEPHVGLEGREQAQGLRLPKVGPPMGLM
jgi:hypothetical protein